MECGDVASEDGAVFLSVDGELIGVGAAVEGVDGRMCVVWDRGRMLGGGRVLGEGVSEIRRYGRVRMVTICARRCRWERSRAKRGEANGSGEEASEWEGKRS